MKKKRVSNVTPKKAAKSKSPVRKKGTAKPSSPRSVSIKSRVSRSTAQSKSPSKSSRITNALKRVPKIAPLKSNAKVSVEPLSLAMPPVEMITDLPFSYNKTELILLVRDPHWAYTYWDFSTETWDWIVSFRKQDHGAKPKLRIHNLDSGTFFDMDIYLDAKNWYVNLGASDTTFQLELGILDSQGKFHRIALSNKMKTPRNAPSENIDPNWELSEFELSGLYRLSGGGRVGAGSEIFSSMRRPK